MTDIFCILRLVDTIWYGSVRSIRWIIVRDIIRQYVLSGSKEDTAQNTINIEMSIRMNISTTSFLLFPYKKFYAAIWVSMQRIWVRCICIYLSWEREREREMIKGISWRRVESGEWVIDIKIRPRDYWIG